MAQRYQRGVLLSAPSGLAGAAHDEPLGCNGDLKTSSTRRHALVQLSLRLGQSKGDRRCDELVHHNSLLWDYLIILFHDGLHASHAHSSGDLLENQTSHGDPRALVSNHHPWNRGGQCKDLYGVNVGHQFTLRARSLILMHEGLA